MTPAAAALYSAEIIPPPSPLGDRSGGPLPARPIKPVTRIDQRPGQRAADQPAPQLTLVVDRDQERVGAQRAPVVRAAKPVPFGHSTPFIAQLIAQEQRPDGHLQAGVVSHEGMTIYRQAVDSRAGILGLLDPIDLAI
jgi:hypothetical protein